MNNHIKEQGALEHPSRLQSEDSSGQEKSEPEPSHHQLEPSVLHSKELLRQRNIFWAFTSISTIALISIFYLVRLLSI